MPDVYKRQVMEYLERFQIDGAFMEKEELAQLTCQVKEAAERLVEAGKPSPTVFEIETAMAFFYFKESGCDFVVLEAGLGGLMDATNVIENPKLCVFASVSMDHIGVLGNTLEEIARDKAGIIKSGSEVVTGRQQPCAVSYTNLWKRWKKREFWEDIHWMNIEFCGVVRR